MSKMTLTYQGDLQVKATHELSGTTLITDAPLDNQGKGSSFSPTDLTATSLGACMATIMGIVAKKINVDLVNMKIDIEKIMTQKPPRRIAELKINITIPCKPGSQHQEMLQKAAMSCPVYLSLHPDIHMDVDFKWGH